MDDAKRGELVELLRRAFELSYSKAREDAEAELTPRYRLDAAKRMQSSHLADQRAQRDARTKAAKIAGPALVAKMRELIESGAIESADDGREVVEAACSKITGELPSGEAGRWSIAAVSRVKAEAMLLLDQLAVTPRQPDSGASDASERIGGTSSVQSPTPPAGGAFLERSRARLPSRRGSWRASHGTSLRNWGPGDGLSPGLERRSGSWMRRVVRGVGAAQTSSWPVAIRRRTRLFQ